MFTIVVSFAGTSTELSGFLEASPAMLADRETSVKPQFFASNSAHLAATVARRESRRF